ncbi:hypothetical protein [Prosthecobacter sp.]|uniref:hypothetical protein n=1 Tax=Prosthecobacter sp. TaxID=1965333 RepID=UPI0037847EF4
MNTSRLHSGILALLCALALAPLPALQAAVVYSGVQDVSIPFTLDGVYVNVATGATSTTQPGTWDTAPWINPFYGGTLIASNSVLRPSVVTGISGNERVLNLPSSTLIDAAQHFAAGYNGSDSHIGAAADQFQTGSPGLLGFSFDLSGSTYYGWMRMTPSNSSSGTVVDWAYEDTPNTALLAGITTSAAPEPQRLTLLLLASTSLLLRRQRRCGPVWH